MIISWMLQMFCKNPIYYGITGDSFIKEGRDDMTCATNDDPTYELLPPISYYEYDATITVTL